MNSTTLREASVAYATSQEELIELVKQGVVGLNQRDLALYFGKTDSTDAQLLKGAPRRIYFLLKDAVIAGEHPSYNELSRATGYSYTTVWRALNRLKENGFIRVTSEGQRNRYEILK